MRYRAIMAVLVLTASACKDSGTGPETVTGPQPAPGLQGGRGQKPGVTSTTPPSRAQVASAASCPARCMVKLNITYPNSTTPIPRGRIWAGNEEAAVVGTSPGGAFYWAARTGSRALVGRDARGLPANANPHGMNNWGQVVGSVGDSEAAVWDSDGTLFRISSSGWGGPAVRGFASTINDNSVIGGNEFDYNRGFRFHYSAGYRTLSESRLFIHDVNFAGTIVGSKRDGLNTLPYVLAADGTERTLSLVPGHVGGQVSAITNSGIMAGMNFKPRSTSGPANPIGVIWSAGGQVTQIAELFYVADVNHWGEVLGTVGDPTSATRCAVWYKDYGMMELPHPGYTNCEVRSINSWGDVVGTVYNGSWENATPVVWTWDGNQGRYQR